MRVLGLALTACVVLALSACSGGSDKKDKDGKGGKDGASKSNYAEKIVGTWEPVKAGPEAAGATMEFTKDNKLTINAGGLKMEGTYKVDGDKLSMTLKGPGGEKTETGKIKELTDTKLVTEGGGKTDEFKRKK